MKICLRICGTAGVQYWIYLIATIPSNSNRIFENGLLSTNSVFFLGQIVAKVAIIHPLLRGHPRNQGKCPLNGG